MNFFLYLCHAYGEVFLVLYDSILFITVPSALSVEITTFSQRIRQVLLTIGAINANNTATQAQRILAMTVVANIFFTVQIVLHGFVAVFILYAWHISVASSNFDEENLTSLSVNSFYWNLYTLIKYLSEVYVFQKNTSFVYCSPAVFDFLTLNIIYESIIMYQVLMLASELIISGVLRPMELQVSTNDIRTYYSKSLSSSDD